MQDVEDRVLPHPLAHHAAQAADQPACGVLADDLFGEIFVQPVARLPGRVDGGGLAVAAGIVDARIDVDRAEVDVAPGGEVDQAAEH